MSVFSSAKFAIQFASKNKIKKGYIVVHPDGDCVQVSIPEKYAISKFYSVFEIEYNEDTETFRAIEMN
ncbi:MAG: hypothetical protein LBF04_02265 [Prevotellaceae bacterium]|jgi:hypothetical protein|nr:hypothetical protein [Prevotellaceae bacterium]